ncbi:hypothetical protein AGMMS49921_13660 [Endomicrobiia bacterium]|nr:hypothetical protein AGMMS49921_13660 [Endomicrobiia bacterium]
MAEVNRFFRASILRYASPLIKELLDDDSERRSNEEIGGLRQLEKEEYGDSLGEVVLTSKEHFVYRVNGKNYGGI